MLAIVQSVLSLPRYSPLPLPRYSPLLYHMLNTVVALGLARRGGGGLGSPTLGLNNRIEGIFLCIIAQFSVKYSPTDTKFIPDGGLTLPDEGLQPPAPLWRHPWLNNCHKVSKLRVTIIIGNSFKARLKVWLKITPYTVHPLLCHCRCLSTALIIKQFIIKSEQIRTFSGYRSQETAP